MIVLEQRIFVLEIACNESSMPLMFANLFHGPFEISVHGNFLALVSFVLRVWIGRMEEDL